jgi:hypothetical protein
MTNTSITPHDIIILNRSNNPPYKSLHIIIKKEIDRTDMILIVETLKCISKTEICSHIDRKVYSKGQQFNAPYNTKLEKYNLTNESNSSMFKPYNYIGEPIVNMPIEDGLIRVTTNIEKINLDRKMKAIGILCKYINKKEEADKKTKLTLKSAFSFWNE